MSRDYGTAVVHARSRNSTPTPTPFLPTVLTPHLVEGNGTAAPRCRCSTPPPADADADADARPATHGDWKPAAPPAPARHNAAVAAVSETLMLFKSVVLFVLLGFFSPVFFNRSRNMNRNRGKPSVNATKNASLRVAFFNDHQQQQQQQ